TACARAPPRAPAGPPGGLRHGRVGGDLRPGGRDLYVVLLEDNLTLFVGDDGLARLPLHLVERRDTRAGKVPLPGEAVTVALRGAGGGCRGHIGSVGRRLLGGSGHRGTSKGWGGERPTSYAVGCGLS